MKKLLLLTFIFQFGLAAETTITTDSSSLTQSFYKLFWNTEATSSHYGLALEPDKSERFFKKYLRELILKIKTGAGSNNSSDVKSNNLYVKLANNFDACLKQSADLNNGYGACTKIYNLRKHAAYIEQCYANIPKEESTAVGNTEKRNETNVGLMVNNVIRNQTNLEKESAINCSADRAKLIIINAVAASGIKFKMTDSNDINAIKGDLSSLHRQLIDQLKSARIDYIIQQNQASQVDQQTALIDTYEFTKDSNNANEVLNAFNDIVTIRQYLRPVNLFNSVQNDDATKIIAAGEIKLVKNLAKSDSNASANDIAKNVNMHRKSLEESIKTQTEQQAKLINSFGTLKENAMLNIASIIAERTIPEGKQHSMLFNLNKAINDSLNMIEQKPQEPAKLLKQIRDAINLNNKLNYMIYLAEERIQMALSVNQIGELKPLADVIDANAKQIDKLSFELDLGSEIVK